MNVLFVEGETDKRFVEQVVSKRWLDLETNEVIQYQECLLKLDRPLTTPNKKARVYAYCEALLPSGTDIFNAT